MAGVLVNQGAVIMLEALIDTSLVLKLFKSDTTPREDDTERAFTEATFTGYVPIVMTPENWVTTSGAVPDVTYPEQTFTSRANQAPELVYGYMIAQRGSGKLVAVERFSEGPYTVQSVRDTITVTATIVANWMPVS